MTGPPEDNVVEEDPFVSLDIVRKSGVQIKQMPLCKSFVQSSSLPNTKLAIASEPKVSSRDLLA